ncbi:hypothetical protein MBLNU13_g11434t1 [Cladosporium sp. NU13]
MSYNPDSTRKRPREDEEDRNLHQHCPPHKKHENVSAHDHARQHNGDQYHGNVNIYHGGGSASRSPEPTAMETALESLMFEEMDARYLTIDALLAPSSCKWLLGREEYKRWRDIGSLSKHHGFLWIKGKAGAGKSTLMKFAFNNAEKTRHEDQTVVSFFFNARGAPIERSLIGMYRALLYQMLYKIPRLQHLLCKKRTLSAQSQDWSLGVLRSVFQDVIENLASEHLICYVDALDECTENDVKEMVSFFEDLGEFSVSSGTKFHVCFASRHYPHITIERSESIVLEDQDGHKEDIFLYIKKKLKISNKDLKGEMSKEIEDRASGVFLWVVLVVGILNDECSRGNVQMIRKLLKMIPSGLTDLIQDILDRDKPTKYLVPLLQWVLFSRRPLTPEELFLALQSIESETIRDSHTPEALARDNIHKFILNTSKGLAEMTKGKKPKVQFIHELVRTHFLGPEGLSKLDPHLQTHLVGQSHDQLKKCCYNYLMSVPCSNVKIPTILPKAEAPDGKSLRGDTLYNLPFLQYALESILYHTDSAHLDSIKQFEFLESFPYDAWRKLHNVMARFTNHRHSKSVSRAYLLAEQGCAALLGIAMQSQPQPDEPEERCRSILGAAVDSRDVKSVQVVLSHKGYESSFGKDNGLCLTHAIESGELDIVQALVAAKVKPYKAHVNSVIHYAAAKNNALVSAGSQPDKFASSLGRFGLLRLLSGNLSSEDKDSYSYIKAVQYASEEVCKYGDLEAFNSLWEGVTWPLDSFGVLFEASASGNQDLVRTILHRGVDVNHSRGRERLTALHAASKAGHEDVVRVLLREGADPRIGSPMVCASAGGHASIVRMLLEHGVDVNAIDPYTTPAQSALQFACMEGHWSIACLLIRRGAKINDPHYLSDSPLSFACIHGRGKIVQMLLQNNADINPRDPFANKPLTHAVIHGHTEVARLLIEHSADIRSERYTGKSPLYWAAYNGDVATARLSISKGASAYANDEARETAYSTAVRRGHTDVAKLLMENGAGDRSSMLSLASDATTREQSIACTTPPHADEARASELAPD